MAIEYRLCWIDQWGDAQECDYADRIDDLLPVPLDDEYPAAAVERVKWRKRRGADEADITDEETVLLCGSRAALEAGGWHLTPAEAAALHAESDAEVRRICRGDVSA